MSAVSSVHLKDLGILNADTVVTIANFIDGKFVPCSSHIDSYNPATGEVWAKIPDSGEHEVEQAVRAANQAFISWSQTSTKYRADLMNRIADLFQDNFDMLAEVESRDQGKPVSLAKAVDIPRLIHNFRFFATVILHETTESTMLHEPTALNYVVREPVGVAGLISPWNLPLYLLSFKIAPAIAYGNTVVAKPSEMTSVSAWVIAKIFVEAGLPPGVVNLVFGSGPKAGEAIVKHPDVRIISFTGSSPVGARIGEVAAPFYKKLSLELGGKNACIVFDDADIEKCVPVIVRSSFANQGEVCLCTSRIFVHDTIYDKFLHEYVRQTSALVVGSPTDPKTNIGALISKEHLAKVSGFVRLAEQEGAMILCGQEPISLPDKCKNGYYMRPTVIANVADSSKLMQEEIFGPVTCVVPFSGEEEVVRRANAVKYGLCACIWSKDVNKIHKVAQKLQAATVWCNCWLVRDLNMPFGGTKASGVGREGAKDSLELYTEKKTVCLNIS